MGNGKRAGFSVLEILIVVLLVGILVALSVPLFSTMVKQARFSALANDLRTYAEAFQSHATEEGDYPSSFTLPSGRMAKDLSTAWSEPSPVGGAYEWVYTRQPQASLRSAYIQISGQPNAPLSITQTDIIELDKRIDDGNIATGYLQLAGQRLRYYLKQPNP